MSRLSQLVAQIELHSPEGIRRCFENGISPNELYNDVPLIYELTSEYTRSPRFKDCVQAFVDHGLNFEDKVLLSVLLNDAAQLRQFLSTDPQALLKRYSLRCAYTPMQEVTLLHICAEFNHVACAEVLADLGIDLDAPAGTDEYGFGAQTAIFHTVNQNNNQSVDMLHFLLSKNASVKITVQGLIWGKGYEWETLVPAVNPISYAMMGLLPQMHRNERVISDILSALLKYEFGIDYQPVNIPNKYLQS